MASKLPSELLLTIFKYVYTLSQVPIGCDDSDECDSDADEEVASGSALPKTRWDKSERLDCATCFPYALSSVCRQWLQLLSLVPEFWTRLILYVDVEREPASLEDQLRWSKGLPFSLQLLEALPSSLVEKKNEDLRVLMVIDALLPHISRCTCLEITTRFSSALPSISTDFLGHASKLLALRLFCGDDDGEKPPATWPIAQSQCLSCPALRILAVDGSNMLSLCLGMPTWFTSLTCLTVCHFEARRRGGQGFPIYPFLHAISHMNRLAWLMILDINFSITDLWHPPIHPDLISSKLNGLTSDALTTLLQGNFQHGSIAFLRICDCQLPLWIMLPSAMLQSFRDMPRAGSGIVMLALPVPVFPAPDDHALKHICVNLCNVISSFNFRCTYFLGGASVLAPPHPHARLRDHALGLRRFDSDGPVTHVSVFQTRFSSQLKNLS